MECIKQQLFNFSPPLVYSDLPPDPTALIEPPDVHQLKIDIINVEEGRVDIKSFSQDYQQKIINFYRFSGSAYTTKNSICAKRTTDTLDII